MGALLQPLLSFVLQLFVSACLIADVKVVVGGEMHS